MENTESPIQEMEPALVSPSEGNFSPLPPSHRPWDTKKMIFGITILIAILIPVAAYFTFTQRQTTQSDANTQQCPLTYGSPVGRQCPEQKEGCDAYVYVECSRDGSKICALQGHTFDSCPANCKRFGGDCTEKCHSGGREVIQKTPGKSCGSEPTPTVPQKTYTCPEPNECVDATTAKARGCVADPTNVGGAQQCQIAGPNVVDGYCCPPKQEPVCPSPNTCVYPPAGSPADLASMCIEGTVNKEGSAACQLGGQGICCQPPTKTPPPTPTPTEIPEPTPTLPPGVTPTATPPITRACILPIIDVTVECAVCGTN